MTADVCYGPVAVGHFFIEELNPGCPVVYEATGLLVDGVMICQKWGMNQDRWVWTFGLLPNERGWQVAVSNLENMRRTSKLEARHHWRTEFKTPR